MIDTLPMLGQTATPLPWFDLIVGLFGGLAVFLLGMDMMAEALKLVAGDRMRVALGKLTTNRFTGVASGAVVTSVLQSSSVTTVMTVGFVSAGLMSFQQSIGIIFGANIGTTVTAQIIAFKITDYALVMIAIGYPVAMIARGSAWRHYGHLLAGLGLIFFGMVLMGQGMAPLKSYAPFQDLMVQMANPLLGLIVGAIFTALVQSSSATTGIVITMASQGLITLPAAIALTLGANVGTCVTALLASLGKSREAQRVAAVHVLFNVAGALLWIGFTKQLASLVSSLSTDLARQVAHAHTVFNIVNTVVFIGFTTQIARLVIRVVPEKPVVEPETIRPQHLDESLLSTPALALEAARQEIRRMGTLVADAVEQALPVVLRGSRDELDTLRKQDEDIDALHKSIIDYLRRVSQKEMTPEQVAEADGLIHAANSFEMMGDVIENNLVEQGYDRVEQGVVVSEETAATMGAVHHAVCSAVQEAAAAVGDRDIEAAARIASRKKQINELARKAADRQRHRLLADAPKRIETYRVETDVLEKMKRIYTLTRRMCRHMLPEKEPGHTPVPESTV